MTPDRDSKRQWLIYILAAVGFTAAGVLLGVLDDLRTSAPADALIATPIVARPAGADR